MSHQFVLCVTSGDFSQEVPIGEESLLAGRGPTARLRLPDDYCSREHGRFQVAGGRLEVEDLGARNGIFVNGSRIRGRVQLHDKDEVRMGRTVILVRATEAPQAPSTPATTTDLGTEGEPFLAPALELGYRLVKLVAVSGMGMLFEASDVRTNRKVAFKILRPDRATEANVARAVEEAKSLSSIHHDHIVRILGTGRMQNGESFLVMDYVEGMTTTQLGRAGLLHLPEALKIATEACSALQAVHERGMVHRDVKPSNLMVENGTWRTVLIDFSLALTQPGGLAGAPAGTIIYCAPEQVQPLRPEDAMNPRVDVYGLGGTLYYMLAGAHPFRGQSTLDVQRNKIEGILPQVEGTVPGAVPELAAIVRHCLQPRPEDRYPSLAEVRRDLEKVRGRYPPPTFDGSSRDVRPAPVRKRKAAR